MTCALPAYGQGGPEPIGIGGPAVRVMGVRAMVTITYEGQTETCTPEDAAKVLRKLKRQADKVSAAFQAKIHKAMDNAKMTAWKVVERAGRYLGDDTDVSAWRWDYVTPETTDGSKAYWAGMHVEHNYGSGKVSWKAETDTGCAEGDMFHAELVGALFNHAGYLMAIKTLGDDGKSTWRAVGVSEDVLEVVTLPTPLAGIIEHAIEKDLDAKVAAQAQHATA